MLGKYTGAYQYYPLLLIFQVEERLKYVGKGGIFSSELVDYSGDNLL
jgi:hypothetical protein